MLLAPRQVTDLDKATARLQGVDPCDAVATELVEVAVALRVARPTAEARALVEVAVEVESVLEVFVDAINSAEFQEVEEEEEKNVVNQWFVSVAPNLLVTVCYVFMCTSLCL